MIITNERMAKTKFKDVHIGDVIRFVPNGESVYMVTSGGHDAFGDHINLVCLEDGMLYFADDNKTVEVLNTELIIKK